MAEPYDPHLRVIASTIHEAIAARKTALTMRTARVVAVNANGTVDVAVASIAADGTATTKTVPGVAVTGAVPTVGQDVTVADGGLGSRRVIGVASTGGVNRTAMMRAHGGAAQSFTAGAPKPVTFATVDRDTHSAYQPVTGSYVVPLDGVYVVTYSVQVPITISGLCFQYIGVIPAPGQGETVWNLARWVPALITNSVSAAISVTDTYWVAQGGSIRPMFAFSTTPPTQSIGQSLAIHRAGS